MTPDHSGAEEREESNQEENAKNPLKVIFDSNPSSAFSVNIALPAENDEGERNSVRVRG